MAGSTFKVDYRLLQKKAEAVLQNRFFEKYAYKKVSPLFKRAKSAMLRQFNEHEVTKEIENGPSSENISDTIGGGYGNLFSFIGFDHDSTPIEPLRDLLDEGTTLANSGTYSKRVWSFRVKMPNKDEIEGVTEMPWESSSWAEGIEHGISGLNYYLYIHWDNGRSEEGVQLKDVNLDNIFFKPRPYLTEILGDFREKINNK